MLFSDADGRKVVSTANAETIGKVHDYVVDPQGPRVAALLLKKTDKGLGDVLRWGDIVAFGTDAVTIEGVEKISEAGGDDLAPLLDKRNHLHKKRVLSVLGDELGTVKDIDFDPATGTVTSLVLDDKSEVPGSRLVGVGSYAVVVETDTASASTPSGPPPLAASAPPAAPVAAPAPPAAPPPAHTTTTLDLTPPDLSQAERASYPPAE